MPEPMIPLSQVIVYKVSHLGAFQKRRREADAHMLVAFQKRAARAPRAQNPVRTVLASIRQVANAPNTPCIREMFC